MLISSQISTPVEFLQPTRPLLVNLINDESQVVRLAISANEVELMYTLDRESFIRNYPPLPYRELDRQLSAPDPLYNESYEPVFLPPIQVPIYVAFNPTDKLLHRFGIDAPQEALALFSISWCRKYIRSEFHPSIGDRIGYHEIELEIITFKFTDYFANTQIPLHWVATLKNLRSKDGIL